MPLERPNYQLELPLDLPDTDENEIVTPEQARLRSETARTALDGRTELKWLDEYRRLREGGWPWRVAAYIAWASAPRAGRTPKTQDELALNHLGLTSDRAIATWRKRNPAIDEMIGILQSAPLWDNRADVFGALIENATKPDYKTHNDRKLFLELTNDYVPSAKLAAMITKNGISTNELSEMSDEDLLALAKRVRDEAKTSDEDEDENE